MITELNLSGCFMDERLHGITSALSEEGLGQIVGYSEYERYFLSTESLYLDIYGRGIISAKWVRRETGKGSKDCGEVEVWLARDDTKPWRYDESARDSRNYRLLTGEDNDGDGLHGYIDIPCVKDRKKWDEYLETRREGLANVLAEFEGCYRRVLNGIRSEGGTVTIRYSDAQLEDKIRVLNGKLRSILTLADIKGTDWEYDGDE